MGLEIIPFDLRELFDNLGTLFRKQASDKEIELYLQTPDDDYALLSGDPLRLAQVLINLLGNALKFTRKGEVELKVAAAGDEENEEEALLRFTIQDSGIGIPKEKAASLFDSFVQADATTSRRFGGTGLGLSISRRLVEMMGGEIGVDSREGKGSTFWFTARFQRRKGVPVPRFRTPDSLQGARVLVVDASQSSRLLLGRYFSRLSFEPTLVKSGEEALQAVRKTQGEECFKLILMDWRMPGMDGHRGHRTDPGSAGWRYRAHPGTDRQRHAESAPGDA